MALPTRHFRLGFDGPQVMKGINEDKKEDPDILGLFKFVLRGMKFSYDYVYDGTTPQLLPNGTWTGILGRLNRSEIDYMPEMKMLSEENSEVAAYNYPYKFDEIVFVTNKPEYTPEIMSLFRTLSLNVWLSLLACIILVTLVCFMALKHRCTLDDILLHVLAIGLNQEGNLVPKRVGEVMLLCTWTGAMAVFTFCFKSVLLSFLTFPPLGGVRTVPELAAAIRAGQYIPYTIPLNTFYVLLEQSSNEDLKVIGESMKYGYMFHLIKEPKYKYPRRAFVYYRSYVSFSEEKMYISKDNMMTYFLGTQVSNDFCCKDEMDMIIHRFLAAGIDQKINSFEDYTNKWQISQLMPDDGEKNRKLTMTDLLGAFIILVAGHCLSICILIIECCVKRREKRRS